MKVSVSFLNEARTRAQITITPSWLARVFGACTRTGEARRTASGASWVWSTTDRDVDGTFSGRPVMAAIELQDVLVLPRAEITAPSPWPRSPRPQQ